MERNAVWVIQLPDDVSNGSWTGISIGTLTINYNIKNLIMVVIETLFRCRKRLKYTSLVTKDEEAVDTA